jgi:hypothetical protein
MKISRCPAWLLGDSNFLRSKFRYRIERQFNHHEHLRIELGKVFNVLSLEG